MFNTVFSTKARQMTLGICLIAMSSLVSAGANHSHDEKSVSKKFAGKRYLLLPQKINGSGVSVYQLLSNKPELGKTTRLTLRVNGLAAGNSGLIKVTADAGLNAGGSIERQLDTSASVLTLDFTPTQQGLQFITVFTEQNGRHTVAQVPVQVGTLVQKPKVNGQMVIDYKGEKIIEMRAQ